MLSRIVYPVLPFDRYRPLIAPQLADSLTSLAEEVRHLKFVHLNSTAIGGGVAEVLQSLVPFMNSLGVATERVIISPPPEFFLVTKRIHNLLQGAEGALSAEELDVYFQSIQAVADDIQSRALNADVWFLHDPQLLPLAGMLPKADGQTRLWVCHIDLTEPNPSAAEVLFPLTRHYDGLIFSLDSYVPRGLNGDLPVSIVPPAIDPLTEKNVPLAEQQAREVVASMGIDANRPLVTQVSRFDLWKDPWGVIDAYRIARQEIPGLQLALLGLSQAADDPEALEVVDSVTEHAAQDPDIHLYFYPEGLGYSIDRIVNAFQSASEVVLQKSIREGFGLTVAETMWKGRPLVGGNVGGIRLQIEDGVSGFLVDSPAECAQCIVELVRSQALRQRIGQAARESVRQKYLLPRLALEYLEAARPHISDASLAAAMVRNGQYHGFADLDVLPEA
jgi:trehalose synthase